MSVPKRGEWPPDRVADVRAALMVRLAARGLPYRAVAGVMGCATATAFTTLKTMPVRERERLASVDLAEVL